MTKLTNFLFLPCICQAYEKQVVASRAGTPPPATSRKLDVKVLASQKEVSKTRTVSKVEERPLPSAAAECSSINANPQVQNRGQHVLTQVLRELGEKVAHLDPSQQAQLTKVRTEPQDQSCSRHSLGS